MINFEKHINILKLLYNSECGHGIAVVDDQPVPCLGLCNNGCQFKSDDSGCADGLIKWLFTESESIDTSHTYVDLSEVVDVYEYDEENREFTLYNPTIKTILDNATEGYTVIHLPHESIGSESHWIPITNSKGDVMALRCKKCKNSPKYAVRSDCCPNCGRKMVEYDE